jgi:hypothetical protein
MADNHYDAIVVGSGISGGWAAKELTEKGLKVLMLERGRNIEHVKDYVNAMKEAWDFPHRNRPTQAMKAEFPVLMRDYGLAENLEGMWANEQESPYIETKRFDWFRGYHVGGRSLMWGRQSYRFSDLDFDAVADLRLAVDEACTRLIRSATPGATLVVVVDPREEVVVVEASTHCDTSDVVTEGSFSWHVLSSLTDDPQTFHNGHASNQDGLVFGITLTTRRAGAPR